MAKKSDFFPSKYLSAPDLGGQPLVLTIEQAVPTTMKGFNGGAERQKIVLHFVGAKKTLPLNSVNWDSLIDITGYDDTEMWLGARIEVYPAKTEVNGNPTDCIRFRKPTELPLGDKKTDEKLPPSVANDGDDPLPF